MGVSVCLYTQKHKYVNMCIYIYTHVHKYVLTYVYRHTHICVKNLRVFNVYSFLDMSKLPSWRIRFQNIEIPLKRFFLQNHHQVSGGNLLKFLPWRAFVFERICSHVTGEGNGNPLVFLPGESQGRGSLVGCCLRGRTESDTTEAT